MGVSWVGRHLEKGGKQKVPSAKGMGIFAGGCDLFVIPKGFRSGRLCAIVYLKKGPRMELSKKREALLTHTTKGKEPSGTSSEHTSGK